MLLGKEFFILTSNLERQKMRTFFSLAWMITGVFFILNLEENQTPLDLTNQLYTSSSFVHIIFPSFLILFTGFLIAVDSTYEVIRYKDRVVFLWFLYLRFIYLSVIFTIFYFCVSLVVGFIFSEQLNNLWVTQEGKPFLLYQNQVDLTWYSWSFMTVRYLLQTFLLILIFGAFAMCIYLLVKNIALMFIISLAIPALDLSMKNLYDYSLFVQWLSVDLAHIGDVMTLLKICACLVGVALIELTILQLLYKKHELIKQ
ncbi:hypothetical protein ACQCU3_06185 [Bacillus altitudinis]|uniref:hypothetical protein n=1 Tax=Bacillus altitudinis TaxID=293387 RepID=UPI0011E8AD70|nr:hypothetical protein [Bacillus altitudinis]TYS28354.1 hypothetical protein FZC69_08635 [Bacillus altitudinis]